jgi:thiol:disulfide interchange protein DsbD
LLAFFMPAEQPRAGTDLALPDHNLTMMPMPSRLLRALWFCALALLVPGAMPARAADFMEPEKAFVVSAEALAPDAVEVRFAIADGYYLYRDKFKIATTTGSLGEPQYPKGKVKYDQTFSKDVETFRADMRIRVPLTSPPADGHVQLDVTSQGCADAGLCYPPMTQKVSVHLPAAGEAAPARDNVTAAPRAALTDSSTVERVLRGGSWWTAIGAFFVMGLLLSFTPCVLPMLPILSSIIAGGGEVSRKRGLLMAVAYSLGMALVYTALGVAAGLAGEGLAAAMQKPWVLGSFGLLLAAFSLSMFDVYELRLPHALSNRLHGASTQLPGGKFIGVFLMGGLSALIVSPCITAPLAGALVFLSQTRDVVFGGSALFAMAVGMSVPLLALGASAGAWLPRSGSWMNIVKHFFGMLLLAVAMWVVQPVLPAWAVLSGWGALLLVTGFMLRPFDANPHSAAPRVWLQRAAGVAALALGVMQLAGAASGAHDPLQPLATLAGGAGPAAQTPSLPFRPVRSVAELDAVLDSARGPVMLDFYADWCVSCKEMERFTFQDAAVRERLGHATLLKADVTANSADDKALLQRFGLFGPPGTLFFDAKGQELSPLRVVGFVAARPFEQTLQAAGL